MKEIKVTQVHRYGRDCLRIEIDDSTLFLTREEAKQLIRKLLMTGL